MHCHALAFIVAFAIVPSCALTPVSANDSDIGTGSRRPLFKIRTPHELRPSGGGKPQFQSDSDAMLEIDLKSVENGIEPGSDSRDWGVIRSSVSDFIAKSGKGRRIHVRIYGVDSSIEASTLAKLHASIKRELAELPIYIVLIDDETFPWAKHMSHHWSVVQDRE